MFIRAEGWLDLRMIVVNLGECMIGEGFPIFSVICDRVFLTV
jgi:hypothetical protein